MLKVVAFGLTTPRDSPHRDRELVDKVVGFKLQQSWFGEFEQRDKWSFCLRAARMAARQERP
jgi:hypothetical protein